VNIWDERKLANSLRIAAKELTLLKDDARRVGDTLSEIEGDGDRAEMQRERGEAWSELVDSLGTALEELDSALENVRSLL